MWCTARRACSWLVFNICARVVFLKYAICADVDCTGMICNVISTRITKAAACTLSQECVAQTGTSNYTHKWCMRHEGTCPSCGMSEYTGSSPPCVPASSTANALNRFTVRLLTAPPAQGGKTCTVRHTAAVQPQEWRGWCPCGSECCRRLHMELAGQPIAPYSSCMLPPVSALSPHSLCRALACSVQRHSPARPSVKVWMPPKMKALLPHRATEWPSRPASSGGDTGSAAQAAPGLLLEGHRRTTCALLVDGVPCGGQGPGFVKPVSSGLSLWNFVMWLHMREAGKAASLHIGRQAV
jgi:hypothetical protein